MSNELDEFDDEMLLEFPPYDVETLTEDDILSDTVMNYLVSLKDSPEKIKAIEKVKAKAREYKLTSAFNKVYKMKEKQIGIQNIENSSDGNQVMFPEISQVLYNSNRYEITKDGVIFEKIPDLGSVLVCYHPILPIAKYKNLEDGSTKIKLAYYIKNKWEYVIVDKTTISNTQSIVKLSDVDIDVTSENARFLIKYLAEMQYLNKDKMETHTSISRLGWFGDVLAPYSDKYEFDNEREMPDIKEKFGESGNLEEWINFFKERRKYNSVSRIVMASAVASILLKKIKQPGFTLHIWGESEYGKTVACMVGQSIFGNPAQGDSKGIGINFNFTAAGLEYKLNTYNNIPLFINEMQHQKDAKDYDKILFLVSEGKGRTRSTKVGGTAKENSWNNIVITNGEKNIIKENSNAGAYNRCISCEVTDYSFENLAETADFVKINYGTPIREILKHLDKYDCNAIFKNILEELKEQDTTNKQKILEAIILLGDKIFTDIIFKDEYYLTAKDFENKTIKKKDVAVEERAYEFVRDWYVSEKRHFLSETGDETDNQEIKVEIYGKDMRFGYVAIIPSILRKVLQDNGYDMNEVLNAWKRKGYIRHEKNRNMLSVLINKTNSRCVVLDMKRNITEDNDEDDDFLPF